MIIFDYRRIKPRPGPSVTTQTTSRFWNAQLLAWVVPFDVLMIVKGHYTTMRRQIVLVALLGIVIFGMTGCFFDSSSSNQPGSNQTACDPAGKNCQSATSSSYWGFVF
jgi:hypothetical protein